MCKHYLYSTFLWIMILLFSIYPFAYFKYAAVFSDGQSAYLQVFIYFQMDKECFAASLSTFPPAPLKAPQCSQLASLPIYKYYIVLTDASTNLEAP